MTKQKSDRPHGTVAYCGAHGRQRGAPCKRPAGWGTDHVGQGRCKLHGGCSPIRSGRYSTIERDNIAKLIAQFEADPNPLDMRPELAAMRALFVDYIQRYDEFADALLAWHDSWGAEDKKAKPHQILDIADAGRLLAETTKIVERIEKLQADKVNNVTRADLARVMLEMGRIVEVHANAATWKKIKHDWLGIKLA